MRTFEIWVKPRAEVRFADRSESGNIVVTLTGGRFVDPLTDEMKRAIIDGIRKPSIWARLRRFFFYWPVRSHSRSEYE